ncbi:hypothetical protein BC827DRAFT_527231 [Russula dissimulans]|nr:hypothetical protein BC827DRAFT_527231 [Russula dissimulans]
MCACLSNIEHLGMGGPTSVASITSAATYRAPSRAYTIMKGDAPPPAQPPGLSQRQVLQPDSRLFIRTSAGMPLKADVDDEPTPFYCPYFPLSQVRSMRGLIVPSCS